MIEAIPLPRGGYILTKDGKMLCQFGVPPETIKDSIKLYGEAPQYYIIPKNIIDRTTFLNVGEVEFPIYYNYFVRRRKTYIICSKDQKKSLEILFKESLIGPNNIYEDDFHSGITCNIPAEMMFFRRKDQTKKEELFEVFDSVEFIDIQKEIPIGEIIVRKEGDNISFYKGNEKLDIKLGNEILTGIKYDLKVIQITPSNNKKLTNFRFPRFGFTCLGSSNGFDPDGTTSGFILWINGKGIFIDPPAHSFNEVERNNIPISSIVAIILTHCHADHDAGTLQSMLRGNKVKIYTTKTIWESFKRKYSKLLDVKEYFFDKICEFKPIKVGREINIENAVFKFHYTLHSIPTIGFTVEFEGKTLFYSSDTFVSDRTKLLLDEGIINQERYNFVMNEFKNYDYILHEAGGGIIHTEISKLNFQTREDQYVYAFHCSEKDYLNYISANPNPSLLYPKQGIENSVVIISQKRLSKFDVLSSVKLFLDLPLRNIKDMEDNSEFEDYKPGEVIIKEGDTQNKDFYIIVEGYVNLFVGEKLFKEYLVFDFFGESAILTKKGRSATIVAGNNGCKVLRVKSNSFLKNIKGTKLYKKLLNLAHIRGKDTWNIFSTKYFEDFTPSMKTYFEMILNYEEVQKNTVIYTNKKTNKVYILIDGEVMVVDNYGSYTISSENQKYHFLGDPDHVLLGTENEIKEIKVISERAKLFYIKSKDFKSYFYDYPVILPRLKSY
ncbi:MAG: cyclic nucleotide-binding domain-containing protein [Brevinematales bacterium]|nr:cyclic nucleotide-binding domain-containing protein [Brevinematales bacterium]